MVYAKDLACDTIINKSITGLKIGCTDMAEPTTPNYEELLVYEEPEGTWQSPVSAVTNYALCGIKG